MSQVFGTTVTLDAAGERIIQAIAQGSWAYLTRTEFAAYCVAYVNWNEGTVAGSRSGYHAALDLIRSGETSAAAVAEALGGDGQNGQEGNIWSLFDESLATRVPVGKPKAKAKPPRHYPPIECSSYGLDEDIVLDKDDIQICSKKTTIVSSAALAFISGMPTQEIYRLTCRGLPRTFEGEGEGKFNLQVIHKWMSTPRRRNGCPTNVIDRISRYIDACKDFHFARIGYVD